MTDIEQVVFLDQIQVGDRFRLAGDSSEPWLVTGRRVDNTTSIHTGRSTCLVVLIGIAGDGTPRTHMAAGWLPAIRYVPTEALAEELR